MKIGELMALAPVIPVLVIDDVAHARPIAEALVAGGLLTLEVTLRTPAALEVIKAMSAVPGAVVGAGTVVSSGQFEEAVEAGARFIVSPGLSRQLVARADEQRIPILPGVATASDIIRGLELGLNHFKFFPAEAAGGVKALNALCAPFYQCRFCPTGGITQISAPDWLALPQVACVGGSWIVPTGSHDLDAIRQRASVASRLGAASSLQG